MGKTQNLAIIPYLDGDTDVPTIYDAIGVVPIINCRGTFTILGGSVERPEVLRAMESASGYFVQLDELAVGVGQRLAEITGAEWGLISSGCAAAIKHVTTACVTGGNPEKLIRVPHLRGFEKTEVIVPRYSRTSYDHALRVVGVDMIMVDTREELHQAISPRTAMIYLVTGESSAPGQALSLEIIANVAQPHNIPILADAAAEILTIPNVHLDQGATVVSYSGGKAICGPQCAGITLGRKDLLQAAWQASSPHHGPGRDNKIGKEEIIGMLAAVEAWITRNHAGEWQTWLDRLDAVARGVSDIRSVSTSVFEPTGLGNRAPSLTISWDPNELHITGEEVADNFAHTSPRIAVGTRDEIGRASISINPSQMQPGNEEVVIDRVRGILETKRAPQADTIDPPTVDASGDWAVTVHYFTSVSNHHWSLRQDKNWIHGRHTSDHASQAIRGIVEGDIVKLQSNASQSEGNVPFTFFGTVSGDTIEGTIHLGEYMTATYTAVRAAQTEHLPIRIPSGPPLAT